MLLQTPWPPWRGVRQLLHVGSWGTRLDVVASKFREPRALYCDLASSTAAKQIPLSQLRERSCSAVRLVVLSDTHGKHRCVILPSADILVHCGDVLQRYGFPGGRGSAAVLEHASDGGCVRVPGSEDGVPVAVARHPVERLAPVLPPAFPCSCLHGPPWRTRLASEVGRRSELEVVEVRHQPAVQQELIAAIN